MQNWREAFSLRPDVTYLNHGSFGPPPKVVQQAAQRWRERLAADPWDFLARRLGEYLAEARTALARFVGAEADDLVFVDNATYGMNVVARSVALRPGDEVLTTNHEYGAVLRLWQETCRVAGATLVVREVPTPIQAVADLLDAVLDGVTPRTRWAVVSHVTSPTAVIFPIRELCRELRQRSIGVCVDGPHAPAMAPLNLAELDCDYYTASCHKWLSAPFGSGFLYVHPRRKSEVRPVVLSWGRPLRQDTPSWQDEFLWAGTRDPCAALAIPAAIEFLESVGVSRFRERTHALAREARQRIESLTGLPALVGDDAHWYGSMASLPLPDGPAETLQETLFERYHIEVPVVDWNSRRLVRVSCHLYNDAADIDRLVSALRELL